jgi:protein-disulfide isomerase
MPARDIVQSLRSRTGGGGACYTEFNPHFSSIMSRLAVLLGCLALVGCTPPAAVKTGDAYRDAHVMREAVPPKLSLPSLSVDPARARGSAEAQIAIVEFGDYQCPYCRSFHVGTLPKLERAYVETGKVRYFYLDFPLRTHAHAFGAAVAARCAGAQGRYWEMQDLLYAEQARLGEALYVELADELKLDAAAFRACLRSDAAARAVRRDVAEGFRIGVNATPSFLLGRIEGDRITVQRVASGAPDLDTFAREIDALLR